MKSGSKENVMLNFYYFYNFFGLKDVFYVYTSLYVYMSLFKIKKLLIVNINDLSFKEKEKAKNEK